MAHHQKEGHEKADSKNQKISTYMREVFVAFTKETEPPPPPT
jgi:hypothetical protein